MAELERTPFDDPKERSKRIINPNEVRTMDDYARRKPDRMFYVLGLENDEIWEWDGYMSRDDGKPMWIILVVCPKCKRDLKIDSRKKPLSIDDRGLELNEPIRCSYKGEFNTLCNFNVSLEPPKRAEDKHVEVRCYDGVVRKIKIDAVARRA